jgi:DNA-binding IclR family transcriptional regulator
MEQSKVLQVILEHPGCSLTEIAGHLGWVTGRGLPNKQKVHRLMPKLLSAKLVQRRYDDRYVITTKGEKEVNPKGEKEAKGTPKKT